MPFKTGTSIKNVSTPGGHALQGWENKRTTYMALCSASFFNYIVAAEIKSRYFRGNIVVYPNFRLMGTLRALGKIDNKFTDKKVS